MSTKRGDLQRKRPQAHQNSTKFKNDLHDNSDRTKKLNAMSISEVCQKCHDVIQWKIKYRKYKALTKPTTCTRCLQKNVKKAYHVLCSDCSRASKQCAKCMKSEAEVSIIPPEPSFEEKLKMDIEMKAMVKNLPERKRRTFLRYMHGKKKKAKDSDEEAYEAEEEGVREKRVKPKTREQLMDKIKELNLGGDNDFYAGVDEGLDEEDDDESWDSADFSDEEFVERTS